MTETIMFGGEDSPQNADKITESGLQRGDEIFIDFLGSNLNVSAIFYGLSAERSGIRIGAFGYLYNLPWSDLDKISFG